MYPDEVILVTGHLEILVECGAGEDESSDKLFISWDGHYSSVREPSLDARNSPVRGLWCGRSHSNPPRSCGCLCTIKPQNMIVIKYFIYFAYSYIPAPIGSEEFAGEEVALSSVLATPRSHSTRIMPMTMIRMSLIVFMMELSCYVVSSGAMGPPGSRSPCTSSHGTGASIIPAA